MKLADCMTMAEKAAIACKVEVGALTAAGGLVCIAYGVVFTPIAGAACGVVIAGAANYDTLSCDRRLVDDKHFCTTKL
jgi:hypothetical protein